jgi:hypothetical protein
MPVLLRDTLQRLRRLSLAGTRSFGKEQFNCLRCFGSALLLNFVNPIGNCLDDFTRGIARHVFPCGRFCATSAILLLYYSNGLFFRHFR